MRKKYFQKARKGEKGQSLVEFALVVPLLLLLVIGIAEFGRAWMAQNVLTGAVREAARIAVVQAPGGGMERYGGDQSWQSDSCRCRNRCDGLRA